MVRVRAQSSPAHLVIGCCSVALPSLGQHSVAEVVLTSSFLLSIGSGAQVHPGIGALCMPVVVLIS